MNDTEKKLFGTGEEVVDGGNAVTYASDADYMLMNEIPLTAKRCGLCRRDLPEHLQKLRKRMLRCMIKKAIRFMFTITISFSLIASENSAEEPIMSYDMIPEKVGIGQLLYKDGTLADESAEARRNI